MPTQTLFDAADDAGEVPAPARAAVRESLAAAVAEYRAGTCPADELYRACRASLDALTPAELLRAAGGLLLLLGEESCGVATATGPG